MRIGVTHKIRWKILQNPFPRIFTGEVRQNPSRFRICYILVESFVGVTWPIGWIDISIAEEEVTTPL